MSMTINYPLDWFFISVLFFIGAYCMIVSRNIIRLLIGFEIISKSAMIAIIASGQHTNAINLAQSLIIIMILVEVVVIATGLALIVKFHNKYQTIDIKKLMNLKG
jgi:NADH-quinone oxidoreductase subunit K